MSFLEEFQQNIDFTINTEQLELIRAAARDFIIKNVPRLLSQKDSYKIKLTATDLVMLDFCIKYLDENNSAEVIDFKSRMVIILNQEMIAVRTNLNNPLNFFA